MELNLPKEDCLTNDELMGIDRRSIAPRRFFDQDEILMRTIDVAQASLVDFSR